MRNKLFKTVRARRPKRNVFDLSHERKMSMNMGNLVPILCQEVVPGDTFRLNSEVFMRFAPMAAPIMHRVNVYTHFFFVPNRLVYDDWERFITGGVDGQQLPPFPTFELGDKVYDIGKGSLADYLGIPPIDSSNIRLKASLLPFRAYTKIYNEYYRDQNLQPEIAINKSGVYSSVDDAAFVLRRRAWEKDYFTSALPWAQRGGNVMLPIQGTAPVTSNAFPTIFENDGSPQYSENVNYISSGNAGGLQTSSGASLKIADGQLSADLSQATATTINELRRSIRLQEWLEKNARAGSRYIEQILSHFGVKSSDARLQRPEFLGGGKSPVVISEVLQTSSTDETTPQGNMSGHGVAVGNTHSFKKYFEEHGYVIGIMSVLPRTAYQQGVPRHFLKQDKFDYYWPTFAHLGEQPIYNSELFLSVGTDEQNRTTFGYTPRYAEYKHALSTVHGDFRDNLSFWHMGRIFTTGPVLNSTFVQSDPTHGIFMVTDPEVHKLYVQIFHNMRAIRPMPQYGTPTI